MALGRLQGDGQICIDMESHGREDFDETVNVSGTVGWFTSLYPLRFPLFVKSDSYEYVLSVVKERMECVPRKGIGYGVLKYMCRNALPGFSSHDRIAEIQFNYLGKALSGVLQSGMFSLDERDTAPMRAENNRMAYPLEVNSIVINGVCNVEWRYSLAALSEGYLKQLVSQFEDCLHELLLYLGLRQDKVIYTPSDFPLAELSSHVLQMFSDNGNKVETIVPLTSMQSKILAHNMLDQKNCVQHLVCGLAGELNETWMKQSWQDIMDRHQILRSAIQWRKLKEPHQIIYSKLQVKVEVINPPENTEFNHAGEVLDYLQEFLPKRFSVEQSPLWSVIILKESRERNWLVLSYYNSLFDNWSCSVIFDELFAMYESYSKGRKIQMSEKPLFSSYLEWSRKKCVTAAKEYWGKELIRLPDIDYLPGNRLGANGRQEFIPDSVTRLLAAPDTRRIQTFTSRHGITISTLIQGAWARTLMIQTNSTQVVFGVLTSGRTADIREIENVVGMFVNIMPVFVSVNPEMPTLEWLRRLQEKLLQISQYEYLTAEQIVAYSELTLADYEIISMERTSVYVTSPSKDIFSEESGSNNSLLLSEFHNTQRLNVPLRLYAVPANNLSLELKFNSTCYEKTDIEILMDEFMIQLQKLIS